MATPRAIMNERQDRSKGIPATRWSLVGRATGGAQGHARDLVELLRLYLPALTTHLVATRRLDRHRADDLLQAFLTDKVLEENVLRQADPTRGRFRTFLLTVLDRFVIDQIRKESAGKRSASGKLRDLEAHAADVPASASSDPTAAFDRAWARQVLDEVMVRMRDECHASGRPYLWAVFEARVLSPVMHGTVAPPHEELARLHGLASASHASNALGSAKRMFARLFRDVVAQYAADEAEVESEIRDLWDIIARPDQGMRPRGA